MFPGEHSPDGCRGRIQQQQQRMVILYFFTLTSIYIFIRFIFIGINSGKINCHLKNILIFLSLKILQNMFYMSTGIIMSDILYFMVNYGAFYGV